MNNLIAINLGLVLSPLTRMIEVLSHSMIRDALSLIVLGAIAATAQRSGSMLRKWLVDQVYITAYVKPGEEAYDWLFHLWCSHPSWAERARTFDLATRYIPGLSPPWRDDDDKDENLFISPQIFPRIGASHFMMIGGRYFRFQRVQLKGQANVTWRDPDDRIIVQTFARSHKPLLDLLLHAKELFQSRDAAKLVIRMTESGSGGGLSGSALRKHRRSFSTIVLEDGVQEPLVRDVKEFLSGEKYHLARGIPWRRGYLLHGKPGTGKTSTIHALASGLSLPVYVVQLAATISDQKLQEAMTAVPQRSNVVIEDVDAVTVKRESKSNQDKRDKKESQSSKSSSSKSRDMGKEEKSSKVSLSGLLNALDGLAGSEGHICKYGTYHSPGKRSAGLIDLPLMLSSHDDESSRPTGPSAVRPGRADLHIEYQLASKVQATLIFRRFYPVLDLNPSSEKSDTAFVSGGSAALGSGATALEDLRWSRDEVDELAVAWEASVPDREFFASHFQGLLMLHKTSPAGAVEALPKWIEAQRKEVALLSTGEHFTEQAHIDAGTLVGASKSSNGVPPLSPTMSAKASPELAQGKNSAGAL